MLFGGNGMVAADWFTFLWDLLVRLPPETRKPAFLLIDYPGYGNNEGFPPSPRKVLESQLEALRVAVPRLTTEPENLQLNLLGHSLGGSAAAQLADKLSNARKGVNDATANLKIGQLILSASFVNLTAMAQLLPGLSKLPAWFLSLLLTQHWETKTWLSRACKAWKVGIIHGTRDEIVPVSMGKTLRDVVDDSGPECNFVEIKHRDHNSLIMEMGQYAPLMGFSEWRHV